MKNLEIKTPSEYYRMRRPEYFSDSKVSSDVVLTKEVLALELEKISTNQKQDLFEGFCRRLVEKVIAPNLIPQTGPTGGGDGKTDAETYPVSEEISDRWFIPENGWNKDEKWAFAISAKKEWKTKAESDIKNILSTKREYTRIYFISNQTISSKKRKDAQDKFIEKYGIDVVILDGTWLLEEVFKNNFIDITVDSLSLSSVYKYTKVLHGANDVERNKLLEELEEKIQNPNRYSEYDFQKVEDALEAAILARKLEKPREEVEGKFDRVVRFCKKLNFNRLWIRIHYQKAWTYLYYYNDYSAFIEEYKQIKQYISPSSTADELELYVNLFNSLRGICAFNCNLEDFNINLENEKKAIYSLLEEVSKDETRPYTSLKAEIDFYFQQLMDTPAKRENPAPIILKLHSSLEKTDGMIEFPFESYHQMFEEMGDLFPTSVEYDKLIDLIASISEKRSSELAAGRVFLQRGVQKHTKKLYKESIVFYGKAVIKLAKDETQYELGFALRSLGHAFWELGLYWASNNCFISANFIAFKLWYQQSKLDKRTFECTKQLATNELLLGRIPAFLTWYELLQVIKGQIDVDESKDEIPILEMLDAYLSVRLANTNDLHNSLSLLPDILERMALWLSQNIVLFRLGHSDLIIEEYKNLNINSESELQSYFELTANQPLRNQLIYDTDFLSEKEVVIKSKILGCTFKYVMQNDIELLLAAETLAAFFENYLSTSLTKLAAKTEEIEIRLRRKKELKLFKFTIDESGSKFDFEIDKFSFPKESFNDVQLKMVELTSRILANNFMTDDIKGYLENLYKNEELNERLAFVYEHRNFTTNILGDNPKLFFEAWTKGAKDYKKKEGKLINFEIKEKKKEKQKKVPKEGFQGYNPTRHDENKVISIIQDKLWDEAKWNGFGPFYAPGIGYGIFLSFVNGNPAKSIFENWITRFGKEDTKDIIKVTIIKGVNKENPYWYKVHITANMVALASDSKERFFNVTARFHLMTPNNPENMHRIEQIIKSGQKILFCPAQMTPDGRDIEPFFDKGIVKLKIDIKNAWELGLNDPAGVAILNDDNPIIPSGVNDAPVLEILKKRKNK
ncbi:hypothetical protein [Prolixibacter sp. SD074]|uniref:hypothetical protein n=1 Tax=Prolixibacter sp. SD074 TaxID=2652391 RepID=UPI00126BA910|nr:hypothetical protein [Prolixibacter sp. SD074]GET29411.1 hypothetical protein SD074_16130 [Prolixibacter sp. SD074]